METEVGPEHPDLAIILLNLGEALMRNGEYERALRALERARVLTVRISPGHPMLAWIFGFMGDVLLELGKLDQAQAEFEHSYAHAEKTLGREHPVLASALTGQARVWLARGQPARAIPIVERGLGLEVHDSVTLADARFTLARALWDSGRDRPRARQLAAQARDIYAKLGAGFKKEMGEVEPWIASHR